MYSKNKKIDKIYVPPLRKRARVSVSVVVCLIAKLFEQGHVKINSLHPGNIQLSLIEQLVLLSVEFDPNLKSILSSN